MDSVDCPHSATQSSFHAQRGVVARRNRMGCPVMVRARFCASRSRYAGALRSPARTGHDWVVSIRPKSDVRRRSHRYSRPRNLVVVSERSHLRRWHRPRVSFSSADLRGASPRRVLRIGLHALPRRSSTMAPPSAKPERRTIIGARATMHW